jgi:hypothetical protein
MNSGVIALMVATRSWPARGPQRPVRDPCLDGGGIGLGGAKALLDGDQAPRCRRHVRTFNLRPFPGRSQRQALL